MCIYTWIAFMQKKGSPMIYILSIILSFSFSYADQNTLYFGEEIKTCLDQETLWNQFSTSLINSQGSDIWPNDLSTVSGNGLHEGSYIDVTYKSVLGSRTYSYIISGVDSPRTFTYSAIVANHPFEGGAKITIEDLGDHRVLKWEGEYDNPKAAKLMRIFFKNYTNSFFKHLEQRIKKYERNNYVFLRAKGC